MQPDRRPGGIAACPTQPFSGGIFLQSVWRCRILVPAARDLIEAQDRPDPAFNQVYDGDLFAARRGPPPPSRIGNERKTAGHVGQAARPPWTVPTGAP